MSPFLARALVFTFAVTLTLPPGWCCILRTSARQPAAKAQVTRCAGCCHSLPAKAPPAPRPASPRMPVCCACPLNARVAPSNTAPQPALDLAVAVDFVPPPAPLPTLDRDWSANPPYSTSVPLHILRCVWLC